LRTLLFDGDLGLANVDLQLGLMPERDLGGVLADGLALSSAVSTCATGFDIVAGKSGSGALAMLAPERLAALRDEMLVLAGRYDRFVLDLGAGIDGAVRTFAEASGTILVVTTDEPTALTDAYAFIKVTSAQSANTDLRIIVNMAASARDGERTYAKLLKACRNFLRISPPLAGVIRRDQKVRDAIQHQTALLTRHPTADAAIDIETLASRLVAGPPGPRN
jgi:flagellar biosynthesis protein FlhG